MLTCILFIIGSTNFVTPGCLQATGIVTPNEIVHVKYIPQKYKNLIIPYRQRIIKFEDTLEFRNGRHWIQFDYHRNMALKYPNKPMYRGLFQYIHKGNQKRYKFHYKLRRLGLR